MARAQVPTIVTPPGGLAHPRLLAPVLVIVVAGNAAGAMVVEIVAGRMLAPYFGMSIHTWTTVIGVVLTGLAIGHWAGGRIADAYPGQRTAALGLACLAGAVTTVLILPLVALVAGSLSLSGVPLPTAILVTGFAAFLVPSLTAGLVQPIATTVALESLGRRAGSVVGRMLAAGVVGAILGTFLAGFVLIAQLGSAGSIWLVAAVNALLGAMLVATVWQRVAGWSLFALASAFAMTGTALPGFAAPCDHESRYYCISVFPGEMRNLPEARMLRIDALMHSVNHADPATSPSRICSGWTNWPATASAALPSRPSSSAVAAIPCRGRGWRETRGTTSPSPNWTRWSPRSPWTTCGSTRGRRRASCIPTPGSPCAGTWRDDPST
jgi:MFS family permease